MIKHLQKVGNSRGIILDKPILDLLHIEENSAFEITQKKDGLFLKPISANQAYKKISQKHRISLDKLAK
jgi:antitoxin component of MazEF toxin-antitoxin module